MRLSLFTGSNEVSSIQHQLQHLKINPYPECKVIPDDSNISAEPSSIHGCSVAHHPAGTSCDNNYTDGSTPSVAQQHIVHPQQYQRSQTESYVSADRSVPPINHYQSTDTSQIQVQEQLTHQMIGQGMTSSTVPSSYPTIDTNQVQQHQQFVTGHTIPNNQIGDLGQSTQQHPATSANMTMQFMMAVQKTVSQVVNAPSFGFEWVKPDYQFDEIDDQLLEAITSSTPIQRTSSSETDPFSPEMNSSSSSSCSSSLVTTENPPTAHVEDALPLSPNTMEQFYEALEEYTDLYG